MRISALIAILLFCTQANAFEPTGEYTFAEPNFTGGMTVKERTDIPRRMAMILDTTQKMSGHTCHVEAVGERLFEKGDEITEKFTVKGDGELLTFNVSFTPSGATIDDFEKSGWFCGLNGSFSGNWTKDGVKQTSKKSKSKEATSFCSEYIKIKKACYYKAKKGTFPDKALLSLKKSSISEDARDDACKEGFSAYGRTGEVKESVLNRALQNDFTQCYEQLSK